MFPAIVYLFRANELHIIDKRCLCGVLLGHYNLHLDSIKLGEVLCCPLVGVVILVGDLSRINRIRGSTLISSTLSGKLGGMISPVLDHPGFIALPGGVERYP